MKPKTKNQQRVFSLSSELPEIYKNLEPWAFETCIKHMGFRTKTKTFCMSCGHTYKGSQIEKFEECPSCKRKLTLESTRKRTDDQMTYFYVLDTCNEFQIIRFFQIYTTHRAGDKAKIEGWEVIQQWMQPNGKHEVVARLKGGFGMYVYDRYSGDLEVRDRSYMKEKYNVSADFLAPNPKVLTIYKRNGFSIKQLNMFTAYDLLNIITTPEGEVLVKAKQYKLLRAQMQGRLRHWDSVKLCIRHNHIVDKANEWLDYLDLLEYFGKDLKSPKYIFPESLKKEHDRYMNKKRIIDERIRLERKLAKLEEDNKAYQESKKAFFGVAFTKDDLTVRVLESVEEFYKEGKAHRHCVYTNEYYNKPDSLILSASVDGKPVETVEVSISNMKIVQARGMGNKATEHHESIIKLVKRNMRVLKDKRREFKKQQKQVA